MSTLPEILELKIKADSLTREAAAKAIGVNVLGLARTLKGKSSPNKRTAKKYASFLGLSAADFAALVGSPQKKGKAGRKAAKAAKGAKAKAAPKAAAMPKRRGRKPGRPAKAAGAKASGGSLSSSLKTIASAIDHANAILSDSLAVRVHGLGKAQRTTIEAVLGSLK